MDCVAALAMAPEIRAAQAEAASINERVTRIMGEGGAFSISRTPRYSQGRIGCVCGRRFNRVGSASPSRRRDRLAPVRRNRIRLSDANRAGASSRASPCAAPRCGNAIRRSPRVDLKRSAATPRGRLRPVRPGASVAFARGGRDFIHDRRRIRRKRASQRVVETLRRARQPAVDLHDLPRRLVMKRAIRRTRHAPGTSSKRESVQATRCDGM